MHRNDSSSIALYLKTHSIPKSKFPKILVENTTIIAHEINRLQLQILEALHVTPVKKKKNRKIEIILKIATMFWKAFEIISWKSSHNVVDCFWNDSVKIPLSDSTKSLH